MSLLNIKDWSDTQAIHGSLQTDLTREKVQTQDVLQSLYGAQTKLAELGYEEGVYDFSEKRERKGARDAKAASLTEIARTQEQQAISEREARASYDAYSMMEMALSTGNEGMWNMGVQSVAKFDNETATMLQNASPAQRGPLMAALKNRSIKNLELARMGAQYEMKGEQARQTQGELIASREGIAGADRASRETIAGADRTSRETIAEADRQARLEGLEIGSGLNTMLAHIEKEKGAEFANTIREAILDAEQQKALNAGKGKGKSPTQRATDRVKAANEMMNAALQNMQSMYSGMEGDSFFSLMKGNLSASTDWSTVPGAPEMYDFINGVLSRAERSGNVLDVELGAVAQSLAVERFVYEQDLGFVPLPMTPSGEILGGVTSHLLVRKAKAEGWSMRKTMEWHRQKLIKAGVLENESEWAF